MVIKDNTTYICLSIKRFLARSLDLLLYGLASHILLYKIFDLYPIQDYILKFASTLIPFVLMLIIEPLLLHYFGTTTGKFLMGLYVYTVNDNNLTYEEAFNRIKKLVFFGYGLWLPLISLICLIVCFVKAKNDQSLPWDTEGKVVTTNRPMIIKCISLPCIFLISYVNITLEGNAILPKNRGDITANELEENYHSYLQYFKSTEHAPKLSIDEENGQIRQVSLEFRTKDTEIIPESHNIAVSVIMAYVGSQKEIDYNYVYDANLLGLYHSGNNIYYDDIEFEVEDIIVEANVETSGYEFAPGDAFHPTNEEEISYVLKLVMTHK